MYSYPNRTICDVLKEMRESYKTYNFSALASLIEECQMLANRMEASLENQRDYANYRDKLKKLKNDIVKLEKKKEQLEENNE